MTQADNKKQHDCSDQVAKLAAMVKNTTSDGELNSLIVRGMVTDILVRALHIDLMEPDNEMERDELLQQTIHLFRTGDLDHMTESILSTLITLTVEVIKNGYWRELYATVSKRLNDLDAAGYHVLHPEAPGEQ